MRVFDCSNSLTFSYFVFCLLAIFCVLCDCVCFYKNIINSFIAMQDVLKKLFVNLPAILKWLRWRLPPNYWFDYKKEKAAFDAKLEEWEASEPLPDSSNTNEQKFRGLCLLCIYAMFILLNVTLKWIDAAANNIHKKLNTNLDTLKNIK